MRGLAIFVVFLFMIGLVSVVLFLLSDINHRRYRLMAVSGTLVVERGRFLPLGFEPYAPDAEALRAAYAPIPLPPDASIEVTEAFDDRVDLDRALFALLAGWSRSRLASQEPAAVELAVTYVRRGELLPGLSEGQRGELRKLRGDLAYRNGRRLLGEVEELLRRAMDEFDLSLQLGTSHPNDAQRWIDDIRRRVNAYNEAAGPDQPQEPPARVPSPSPEPEPQEPEGEPEPTPKAEDEGAPRWRL